jgi:Transposase DDE domain
VRFYDIAQDRRFCFLSNHLLLAALPICQLYKMRWQVELSFKWIKQHLRIKRFYGNSINAVKTQVWIAVCVYVLVAILKKELQLPQSLRSILQVLSISAFEKVPLNQLLTTTPSARGVILWTLERSFPTCRPSSHFAAWKVLLSNRFGLPRKTASFLKRLRNFSRLLWPVCPVNELEAENVGRQPLANRSRNRWTNGHQPSLRGVVARVDHCFDEFDAGNDFDDQVPGHRAGASASGLPWRV